MRNILLIIFLVFNLYANMGDCLTCHPKLLPTIDTDARHTAMKSCIKCHSASEKPVLECGDKCFSCHSKEDLDADEIKEHAIIEECRKCHVDAIHNLFDTSKSFNQSQPESLQDFLIH